MNKRKITSEDKIEFKVDEVSPVKFTEGLSSFLYEPNRINVVFKLDNISEDEIKHFSLDRINMSVQKYSTEDFKTSYNCYSFTINIGEAFGNGIVFCNFNLCPSSFYLNSEIEEDMGYGFNFILIDENDVIKSIRKIGITKQFSELLLKIYSEEKVENFNHEGYKDSLSKVGSIISNYYNDEVVEKFSIGEYSQG